MLIYNAIQCLNCGDILWSKHRHDFLVCKCGSCMNDGGNDYRRGYVGQPERDLSITSDSPFEKVREYAHRYNRYSGTYVKLKDMSDSWLQNVIDYFIRHENSFFGKLGENKTFQIFMKEKLFRIENEISIDEDSNYVIDFK